MPSQPANRHRHAQTELADNGPESRPPAPRGSRLPEPKRLFRPPNPAGQDLPLGQCLLPMSRQAFRYGVRRRHNSPQCSRLVDESDLVNVIGVDKEIADLITHEDLESIDLAEVRKNVVLPSGALVHDEQAQEIFSKDGVRRRIKRGPYVLTHPYYESVDFNTEELIEHELKSFKALIDKVNLPI